MNQKDIKALKWKKIDEVVLLENAKNARGAATRRSVNHDSME